MQGQPGISSTGIGLHLYLRCTSSWDVFNPDAGIAWHCKATGFLLYVVFGLLCYKLATL